MNADELKILLADVIAPISAIERKTGIPKNVLQQSLKGKRTLPKEWVIRLQEFVEKKQYIGLRRKPRYVPKEGLAFTKSKNKTQKEGKSLETAKIEKKPFMSDVIKKKLGI